MEKIKFSIITVLYNNSSCIKKTIESIVNQTYKNIEYIIIDGNSEDDTLKICNQYKDKIDKLISQPNAGVYGNMNRGMSYISGDYLIFMNCDDTFADEYALENLADTILKKDEPDFIYGNSLEESHDGKNYYEKKAHNHTYLWYGMFTRHQAMVYKISIIHNFNLLYDLNYKMAADYDFTARFLANAKTILYVDDILCIYKQGGISTVHFKTALKEQLKIGKEVLNYNIFKRFLILTAHLMAITVRRKIPGFYNYIRFKKNY